MPKTIYFTDEAYQQIVAAARACGFRVQRGRGSQLAQFVVAAANNACTMTAGTLRQNSESQPDHKPVKKARSPRRR